MILRIKMTFTDDDFIKLLDFCKDMSNFVLNLILIFIFIMTNRNLKKLKFNNIVL